MKLPKQKGGRLGLLGKLVGGAALMAASFTAGQQTAPVPEPEVYQVSVITQDGRDFNGLVVNGKLREDIQFAAPLMNWENADLRQKSQMTWCLDRLPDEASKQVTRELLTTIYAWYTNLPMWTEGCTGTGYFVDDTAQMDCGIGDNAVGCAAYLGERAYIISFNGNLYRDGRCTILCVQSTLAHELGHAYNLGHVNCDHPQPSNMSGIYLPDGPACAAQGTREPIKEDFRDAESYYGLTDHQEPDFRQLAVEVWLPDEGRPCPGGYEPWDGWCVAKTTAVPVGTEGFRGWVHWVQLHPDGQVTWLTDWEEAPP